MKKVNMLLALGVCLLLVDNALTMEREGASAIKRSTTEEELIKTEEELIKADKSPISPGFYLRSPCPMSSSGYMADSEREGDATYTTAPATQDAVPPAVVTGSWVRSFKAWCAVLKYALGTAFTVAAAYEMWVLFHSYARNHAQCEPIPNPDVLLHEINVQCVDEQLGACWQAVLNYFGCQNA